MSLYNMLMGVNPLGPQILFMLGIENYQQIPRFRDCWCEDGKIAVFTRTGGGNRPYYDSPESRREAEQDTREELDMVGPFNSDLRAIEGYISDEDDDFDNTFAIFWFEPKPEYKDLVTEIGEKQKYGRPMDNFKKAIEAMKS